MDSPLISISIPDEKDAIYDTVYNFLRTTIYMYSIHILRIIILVGRTPRSDRPEIRSKSIKCSKHHFSSAMTHR